MYPNPLARALCRTSVEVWLHSLRHSQHIHITFACMARSRFLACTHMAWTIVWLCACYTPPHAARSPMCSHSRKYRTCLDGRWVSRCSG